MTTFVNFYDTYMVPVRGRLRPLSECLKDRNLFHFLPYHVKRKHPFPRSCATCKHRPLDFGKTGKRTNPIPRWKYKPGVTYKEIDEADIKDALTGTMEHSDNLKMFRHCPVGSWSRSAPFYPTDRECYESEEDT